MLDQRGATFHPVSIIHVKDPGNLPHFCLVDVAADYAVHVSPPGFIGESRFKTINELQGVLDLRLQKRRQAPIAEAEASTQAIECSVQGQKRPVGDVARKAQPRGVAYHRVSGRPP